MRRHGLEQAIAGVATALAIVAAGAGPAAAAPARSAAARAAAASSAVARAAAAAAFKTAPPQTAAANAQQCDIAYQRYGACYDYAGGSATATNQGATVSFPVARPVLAYDGYHTLMEMAVFNRTPAGIDQDTAEIGWIVDSQGSGQPPVPHLFIYHFVNTQGTCYDACGFVSTSKTIKPGMALPSGNVTWAIHNVAGRWTFFVNGSEIGYIPDSAYKGTFGHAAQVNVYGEIAGAGDAPGCSQMGNGLFGTESDAETISGLRLFGAAAPPGLTPYYPTDPAAWSSESLAGGGLRVGGPGHCKAMAGTVAGSDGGYTVVGRDTAAYPFPAGQNPWFRPASPPAPQFPGAGQIVGVARDPATGGYWMTDDQGDVYAVNAPSYGGLNGVQTPAPIVGIAAVGPGYVLVTSSGAVYSFNTPDDGGVASPSSPVVGIAGTATGYLIATRDGTVYAVHTTSPGSASGVRAPVTAIAADGAGYLLVDSAGDVYPVGTPNRGSLAGTEIPEPIIDITATPSGYLLTDAIGNVYPFHTPFDGSVAHEGI